MNKPIYLTFDIGTTSLKTALVDDNGHLLAVHAHEYTFDSPYPGWAELDAEVYWNAAVSGVKAVLSTTQANASSIAAIGFSSQGQTFVPIDSQGNPLSKAIIWMDIRSKSIAEKWESDWLSRESFKEISGYPWIPCGLTVFKIAWQHENIPNMPTVWKYLCIPDYIIYRLTGETATDTITATITGYYDFKKLDWDPTLLQAAGISVEQLPKVLPPGTVAGCLHAHAAEELGLHTGVPVCVGANDQIVGAVGAGNVRPGIISETTGTALAIVSTSDTLDGLDNICVGRHAVDNAFYAMQYVNTSAIILKWFRDMCAAGEDYADFLNGIDKIPPGCDGLTVLPHFSGSHDNANARGAIIGLTLSHTRTHISRAIMEACCCLLQDCMDGIKGDCIRSLGGAARSDIWLQMKADMLGIRVERPACSDAASLGAAMLAASGIGRFSSVIEASESWYKTDKAFEPNAELYPIYREVYNRYRMLEEKLK